MQQNYFGFTIFYFYLFYFNLHSKVAINENEKKYKQLFIEEQEIFKEQLNNNKEDAENSDYKEGLNNAVFDYKKCVFKVIENKKSSENVVLTKNLQNFPNQDIENKSKCLDNLNSKKGLITEIVCECISNQKNISNKKNINSKKLNNFDDEKKIDTVSDRKFADIPDVIRLKCKFSKNKNVSSTSKQNCEKDIKVVVNKEVMSTNKDITNFSNKFHKNCDINSNGIYKRLRHIKRNVNKDCTSNRPKRINHVSKNDLDNMHTKTVPHKVQDRHLLFDSVDRNEQHYSNVKQDVYNNDLDMDTKTVPHKVQDRNLLFDSVDRNEQHYSNIKQDVHNNDLDIDTKTTPHKVQDRHLLFDSADRNEQHYSNIKQDVHNNDLDIDTKTTPHKVQDRNLLFDSVNRNEQHYSNVKQDVRENDVLSYKKDSIKESIDHNVISLQSFVLSSQEKKSPKSSKNEDSLVCLNDCVNELNIKKEVELNCENALLKSCEQNNLNVVLLDKVNCEPKEKINYLVSENLSKNNIIKGFVDLHEQWLDSNGQNEGVGQQQKSQLVKKIDYFDEHEVKKEDKQHVFNDVLIEKIVCFNDSKIDTINFVENIKETKQEKTKSKEEKYDEKMIVNIGGNELNYSTNNLKKDLQNVVHKKNHDNLLDKSRVVLNPKLIKNSVIFDENLGNDKCCDNLKLSESKNVIKRKSILILKEDKKNQNATHSDSKENIFQSNIMIFLHEIIPNSQFFINLINNVKYKKERIKQYFYIDDMLNYNYHIKNNNNNHSMKDKNNVYVVKNQTSNGLKKEESNYIINDFYTTITFNLYKYLFLIYSFNLEFHTNTPLNYFGFGIQNDKIGMFCAFNFTENFLFLLKAYCFYIGIKTDFSVKNNFSFVVLINPFKKISFGFGKRMYF